MKFSLVHPVDHTREAWRDCARKWRDRCRDAAQVEHVVVSHEPLRLSGPNIFEDTKYLVNPVRGSVPSWNLGASRAEGEFILGIADDLEPCQNWDAELSALVPDGSVPAVFEVNHEDQHSLMTHPFMTRGYFKRFGFLNPAFLHVCVDNVFTADARRSGFLVDARHLHFPHVGPLHARYVPEHSLRDELNPDQQAAAFQAGCAIAERHERRVAARANVTLERRRAIGTVGYMGGIMSLPEPFVWSWGQLLAYTQMQCRPGDYVYPVHASMSLHDHARSELIARMKGDWIVMLDCDTAFEPDLVTRVVGVANRYSLEVVTGIYAFKDPPHSPVLYMHNKETDRHDPIVYWDRTHEVFPVDAAGSGCLFIRRRVLERIGAELKEAPFARYGSNGEDMAFFRRLKQLGIQTWCAWRVEMEHLDYKRWRVSNDFDGTVPVGARRAEHPVHGLGEDSLKVAALG